VPDRVSQENVSSLKFIGGIKSSPKKLSRTGVWRDETVEHFVVTMRQRVSIFSITGNYQLYHGISDQPPGGNVGLPVDSYNLRQEWGPAGGATHRLATSVNSKMPLGVYLTTSINAKSGTFSHAAGGTEVAVLAAVGRSMTADNVEAWRSSAVNKTAATAQCGGFAAFSCDSFTP